MVAGLTSTVVVDSEAARKPQKREAAEGVQILSLGTSWHILAHLGTSWHHAASWHRTAIFWCWRCQVQLHSRYLRQEVAQLRRQNAELQNQAWKIIFWGRKVTIWDSQDALWRVGFGLGITHGLHMEVGRPDIEQIQDSGRMTALTRIDYMGFDCLYPMYPFFRDASAPDTEAFVSKYFRCQWHCFAWHVDIHSYLLVARSFWSWHLNRTHIWRARNIPKHVPLAPSIRRSTTEAQLKQVRAGDLQVENLSIIVKDLQDRKMMGWREVQVDFYIFFYLFPIAFFALTEFTRLWSCPHTLLILRSFKVLQPPPLLRWCTAHFWQQQDSQRSRTSPPGSHG